MIKKIQPVVLCGGDGTRLWPLSRSHYPKQLLRLFGETTLLQQTARRYMKEEYLEPIFICNESYRFLISEQLLELGLKNPKVILESEPKDTANAIACAMHIIDDPDTLTLIVPSDHLIKHEDKLDQLILESAQVAYDGSIVTFGIAPTFPSTGYGYIEPKEKISGTKMGEVKKFIEKPQKEMAEQLIQQGCLWNAGIFLFQNKIMEEYFKKFLPENYLLCHEAVLNAEKDLDFIRLAKEPFSKLTKISIDYGIMEKTDKLSVCLCENIGWSDLGDWNAVWEESEKDSEGNALRGDIIVNDTQNCYLRSENMLLSTIGVKDLIVLATHDAVLIADRHASNAVKELAVSIRHQKRSEAEVHKRVYRPWGYYQEIDIGERFKVKRIMVKPGEKTSTQIHHHRAEHWVVVKGSASIYLDNESRFINENEAVYIPTGKAHAIENPGKIDLHLIEVQSGSYLGEDDIVRIKDKYGRV